jgi:hypothetical protein
VCFLPPTVRDGNRTPSPQKIKINETKSKTFLIKNRSDHYTGSRRKRVGGSSGARTSYKSSDVKSLSPQNSFAAATIMSNFLDLFETCAVNFITVAMNAIKSTILTHSIF